MNNNLFYLLGSVDCPYDGDFRCHSDGVCIRSYQVCNGLSHCRDQSDEENCSELLLLFMYIIFNLCQFNY